PKSRGYLPYSQMHGKVFLNKKGSPDESQSSQEDTGFLGSACQLFQRRRGTETWSILQRRVKGNSLWRF
ncbi:hypothetical protein ACQP3J_30170, partial [Escherichia coli]